MLATLFTYAAIAAPIAAATPTQATWPLQVQPFFLSATNTALTPSQALYISRFPVAVINHKQSLRDAPSYRNEERKQIDAIAAIKRANASCTTLFYLNSLIDFSPLDLHQEFAAVNGSWWLKQDDGTFVMQHGGAFTFDWTHPAAQQTWIATALAAMANSSVDGIFVDKAGEHVRQNGVSAARLAAWNAAHDTMLATLRRSSPPSKLIVLNNRHGDGEGQLFERWGNTLDHDLLNITQDIAQLTANSRAGVVSLARAGGAAPGSGTDPDPQACAAGLAAMLVAVAAPNTAFFTCALDFNSAHTWLSLLNESIYSLPLGAPVAARAERNLTSGLMTRRFSSGTVAVLDPSAPNLGCVKWAGGQTTGTCPN
jgi:hypothetical protein